MGNMEIFWSANSMKCESGILFASSSYREFDSRTWTVYYLVGNMVHATSRNYSIIRSNPVTIEEFKNILIKFKGNP